MSLYNLARVVSATAGTGTLTLGAAVSGCLTFALAGVPNGSVVSYGISDGANSEVGRGTYTTAGTTLSRDTVLASTNAGGKINCSGNEQVFITALAEDFTELSGDWKTGVGAWAYASATTITVPSGAASIYRVGDKIKLTQTTVKYFYVVGVADTVLTVTGGSDYAVANAVITVPYYSHAATPVGFPDYFNYAPTGISASNISQSGRFMIQGRKITVDYSCSFTGAIVFTTMPTLPIAASASYKSGVLGQAGFGGYYDIGVAVAHNGIVPVVLASGTTFFVKIPDGTSMSETVPITWDNGDAFDAHFSYEI